MTFSGLESEVREDAIVHLLFLAALSSPTLSGVRCPFLPDGWTMEGWGKE